MSFLAHLVITQIKALAEIDLDGGMPMKIIFQPRETERVF